MLITALAFTAGHLRKELALSLLGAIFLTVLVYTFLIVLVLSLVHKKQALSFSADVIAKLVTAGGKAEAHIAKDTEKRRFFRLPGCLIRYEFAFETKDQRHIRHVFDPDIPAGRTFFPVKERGCYFGDFDVFSISDALGLFSIAFHLPRDRSPRLLAAPRAAAEIISLPIRSGGAEQRIEPHYRKTEDLTDHRPYVPGDDPRRINWKLYGHGPSGELFVREGESEPPPRARIILLVDTQVDPGLYTVEEGRRGVDNLCENALTAALEFASRGMDMLIGYTGGAILGENEASGGIAPHDLAAALALPAALPLSSMENLPEVPRDRGVLLLALPRSSSEPSALDRFLKERDSKQGLDLFFLYDPANSRVAELEEAAKICVNLYGRKQFAGAVKATPAKSTNSNN
ncbi:conserved hypothetical protein [Leadbettera azotonutricia ZAS-9]|uniref:Uncharacterized protein n=2 Tax=Leadbettera azotonutricia TaxID=150829 RepID=F5Y9Y5_LEAAZ|nr:conserved hypothetical protein [Leadbettera azotonutricia ZAS-9]